MLTKVYYIANFYRECFKLKHIFALKYLNTLFKGKIFLQSFCDASIPPYIFLLQKVFFYGAKGFGEICIVSFHVCSITTVVENCSLILSIKFSPQIKGKNNFPQVSSDNIRFLYKEKLKFVLFSFDQPQARDHDGNR